MTRNYLETPGPKRISVFTHDESKHDNGNELRSVRFGTGNTDFWPGIDVHTAMRFTANAASNGVGDTNNQSSSPFAVSQGHQSVSGFSWNSKMTNIFIKMQ